MHNPNDTNLENGPNDQPISVPWKLGCEKASSALSALIRAHVHDFPAGKVLQIANDDSTVVYFVVSGWLTVSKSSLDGHRQIIDFLLSGNVFDPGSADEIMASTDVKALTETKIAVIPRDAWLDFLADNPDAQEFGRRLSAAGYAGIAERMLRIGNCRAETRIAYAFCELSLRASVRGLVAGSKFHLPLTQQVLGDYTGLSSEHVSRTIGRLVQRGLLSYGDHMDILVHDIGALAEVAQIDLQDLRAEILTDARRGRPAAVEP